jgi:acetyl/propionyl-CoA carboxylase alpha subunit
VKRTYAVTFSGRRRTVVVDPIARSRFRIILDGRSMEVDLATAEGEWRLLLVGSASYDVLIERDGTDWFALFNGLGVAIEVEDERVNRLRGMLDSARSDGRADVLLAPMPGLVVAVHVEPGRSVTAGEGIVVVEAMKMENELTAPSSAVVSEVLVSSGQAVEKGQTLVVFRKTS